MVDLERLRLPPRSVQRQHQMRPKLLAQRVLVYALLKLTDQLPVLAELEIGLDPPLQRPQPKRLQTRDRGLSERLVQEIRQRRSPPQRKRLAEEISGRVCIAAAESSEGLVRQPLEPERVELVGPHPEQISRRMGLDDRLACVETALLPDQLAQLGDVITHLRHRSCRNGISVQVVRDLLHRDHPIRVKQQDRQHRALLRPTQLDRPGLAHHLNRTKDAKIHRHRH